MSRSYKTAPVYSHTGRSEKSDKKIWHSRWRQAEKQNLIHLVRSGKDLDGHITVHFREVSDLWSMGKDGKFRWERPSIEDFRYYDDHQNFVYMSIVWRRIMAK